MTKKRINQFQTPLSEELLLSNNFFELYPFDGGGYFIHRKIAGSLDDEKICRKLEHEGALDEFGGLASIDFQKFEFWSTIEKSCWINRMYFVVPLAKMAALKSDDKLSRTVKEVILSYPRNYPPPAGKENVAALQRRVIESRDRDYNQQDFGGDGKTEYQWFDFQPASRIVNALNAMCFLRNSRSISDSDWQEFDRFVFLHGENIYIEEKYNSKLAKGNHQALRGLALLYAAAYFDGESFAAEWVSEGIRICNFHITEDYLPDGTLHEISPSYHAFETWISRDAVNLAEKYHYPLASGAVESLSRAIAVCELFRQPDGKSVTINDGYSLNMDAFLKSVTNEVRHADSPEFFLPDAQIAFWRTRSRFILLDASPFTGEFSHYHSGKNAVSLWFDGVPFVVDSGCCDYDDQNFAKWFKQPFAHSSLLLDGKGDGELTGRYHWNYWADAELGDWQCDGVSHSIESVLISSAPNWKGVEWRRRLEIGDKIKIQDYVTCEHETTMGFVFNLHPEVKVQLSNEQIVLDHGSTRILLGWSADVPVVWTEAASLVFMNFKSCPSKRLIASFRTPKLHFQTIWSQI